VLYRTDPDFGNTIQLTACQATLCEWMGLDILLTMRLRALDILWNASIMQRRQRRAVLKAPLIQHRLCIISVV
jgi:hypothetical protein